MDYLLAVGAVLIWGLVTIPIKLARARGRLGVMVSMPTGLAALALAVLATGQAGLPDASWRDWLFIGVTGLCQFAVGGVAYYEAVQYAGVTVTAPITRLMPLLVVLSAVLLGSTRFSWLILLAAGLTVLGGIVLSRGLQHPNQPHSRSDMRKGIVLAVLTAVLWAGGNLAVDQVSAEVTRVQVTLYSLALGTVFYWVFMAARGRLSRLRRLTRRDWLCYAVHGVLSYAVAYLLLFESIDRLGVSRATVLIGSWPVAAVVVAVAVFREHVNVLIGSGIVLMIGGAVLAAVC